MHQFKNQNQISKQNKARAPPTPAGPSPSLPVDMISPAVP